MMERDILNQLFVHDEIDNRIDNGMRHGKPVKGQKDVLDSRVSSHLRVVDCHNEVGVIGKPTNPEVDQEHP